MADATQEQIESLRDKIKAELINKGFQFGTFEPDYQERFAEAYAKIILEEGGGGSAGDVLSSDITWDGLVDVETMVNLFENELVNTPLYDDLSSGIEDIKDYPEWDSAASYNTGERVKYSSDGGTTYIVYEASQTVEGDQIGISPDSVSVSDYWDVVGDIEVIEQNFGNIFSKIAEFREVTETGITDLEQLVFGTDGLEAAIETEQSIRAITAAPDWSSAQDYAVNDVVHRAGQLYQNKSGSTILADTWENQLGLWTTIDKSLYAQYTVKLDNNGYVSGFGMSNDGDTSAFIIRADQFAIVDPGNPDATSDVGGRIEPNQEFVPFAVDNGKVYMRNAFVIDLSAENFVGNKITANEIILATGINDSFDFPNVESILAEVNKTSEDMLILATNSGEFANALPTIEDGISNFFTRNDRITEIPTNPGIAGDGTAVNFSFNPDGSGNIDFTWTFDDTGNAGNIDGFVVYIYDNGSDASTINLSGDEDGLISNVQYFVVPRAKRSVRFSSYSFDKYYTIGVEAYRGVDEDIDPTGILRSDIVQPSLSTENPIFLEKVIDPPTSVTLSFV